MKNYAIFSSAASLTAVANFIKQTTIWKIVAEHVEVRQKTVRHRPIDKLLDAFIGILSGTECLAQINTTLRCDPALQRAFGRTSCAEQSTISDTLNACTSETLTQMNEALGHILRRCGRAARHRYERSLQVLDVDMSGLPCGAKAEGATGGYFPHARRRRGRQVGRVTASRYGEILVERLYEGTMQLQSSLLELVEESASVLRLSPEQRRRTLLRVDGGGGSDTQINALLAQEYHVLVKVKNWKRAQKLCRSVRQWHAHPVRPGVFLGLVTAPHDYQRPTRQIAVRYARNDEKRPYTEHVLVTTLSDEQLADVADRRRHRNADQRGRLVTALAAYDRRMGTIESNLRASKQGLHIGARHKKRFHAQQMVLYLAQLAANVLTWFHRHLRRHVPDWQGWGLHRLIRDILHIPGTCYFDHRGRLRIVKLREEHILAASFLKALHDLLARDQVCLVLGQT